MIVAFRRSFVKDLHRLGDRNIKHRIKAAIEEVEHAANLLEIGDLKKLQGYEGYYRIRIGDYRLGIVIDENTSPL